jgi:uncharacterized protein (DUF305 family)
LPVRDNLEGLKLDLIPDYGTKLKSCAYQFKSKRPSARKAVVLFGAIAGVSCCAGFFAPLAGAQQAQAADTPVVVQPGAPGQPSKTLAASTRATLPPPSKADVEFMQGMIMHHAQAVEMTALIPSHTTNKDLQTLGVRISRSQSDEIRFMQRWLAARGQSLTMPMPDMSNMDMHGVKSGHAMALMPGMLTPEQMEALQKAKGAEFDRLFLEGMIQHHGGALIMVKELFARAGAGQDAELFNFVTDVDTGQRAEIRIMQGMLDKETAGAPKD